MTKAIKNLTNKLAKMELENKNSQRQVQLNRGGFNPQFRRHPLQILQRERRDQDQIQAPLYIEAAPGEPTEDDQREAKDQVSSMYAIEEDEEEDCEGEYF